MTKNGCPLCGRQESVRLVELERSQLLRCRRCGLTYVDPRPSVETVRQYYDEKIYIDPATTGHIDDRRRALFTEFLDRVHPEGQRRLLDIGCGTGEFLKLARERGWDASGVELSLEAVERANRLGLSVYLGMLPDQGETDMSFPDRFFDIVTLWNVLDVLPRPVDQLREINRVLAPGGRIFIRTPNQHFHLFAYRLSRLFRWPAALAKLLQDSYIFHPFLWSPRSLRLILRHEGFTDVRIWNSPLSLGDPYLVVPEERERLMRMIKKIVYGAARAAYLGSGKKWLLGSSLSVLAKKPGEE
jgi:SAM-dependent methyltransferase